MDTLRVQSIAGVWTALVIVVSCVSSSACAPIIPTEESRTFYPAARLTFVGTKTPLPIVDRGERVEGKNCKNFLLAIIPTSSGDPIAKISEAIQNALEGKAGDILVDGIVSEYFWFVPGIWAQHCYKVEGYVARAAFGLDLVLEQEHLSPPNP